MLIVRRVVVVVCVLLLLLVVLPAVVSLGVAAEEVETVECVGGRKCLYRIKEKRAKRFSLLKSSEEAPNVVERGEQGDSPVLAATEEVITAADTDHNDRAARQATDDGQSDKKSAVLTDGGGHQQEAIAAAPGGAGSDNRKSQELPAPVGSLSDSTLGGSGGPAPQVHSVDGGYGDGGAPSAAQQHSDGTSTPVVGGQSVKEDASSEGEGVAGDIGKNSNKANGENKKVDGVGQITDQPPPAESSGSLTNEGGEVSPESTKMTSYSSSNESRGDAKLAESTASVRVSILFCFLLLLLTALGFIAVC